MRAYNVKVTQLPGRLIAGFLGYKERPFFEAAAGSDVAPKVKF